MLMQMVTDRFYVITWEKLNLEGKTKTEKCRCVLFCLKSHNILFHFLCQDIDQRLTIFGAMHDICRYFIPHLTSMREWIHTSTESLLIIYSLMLNPPNLCFVHKMM